MKQIGKPLSLTLGLLGLATVLVLINTGSVGAQTRHVNIVAAPTLPTVPVTVSNVPLPVQGAVNANITNGSVPVTGSVSVNSLPAVQLSGTPAVSVTNTATTPVYVDADRAARNGFNASCFTGNVDPVYAQASCTLFTIPPSREVVIESVACTAEVTTGTGPGQASLIVPGIPLGGGLPTAVYYSLAMSKQSVSPSVDLWSMTTPLRVYAASGSGSADVGLFFIAQDTAQPQGLTCAVSGYEVGQ